MYRVDFIPKGSRSKDFFQKQQAIHPKKTNKQPPKEKIKYRKEKQKKQLVLCHEKKT